MFDVCGVFGGGDGEAFFGEGVIAGAGALGKIGEKGGFVWGEI